MNRKKRLTVVGIAALLFLGLGALLLSLVPPTVTSTHHAHLMIKYSDGLSKEQQVLEYEKILKVVKSWALESGMRSVDSTQEQVNSSSFSSNSENQPIMTHFKDKQASNLQIPLHADVTLFPGNSFPHVVVMIGEGYSKKPSGRLCRISKHLFQRLKKEYNGKVEFLIDPNVKSEQEPSA